MRAERAARYNPRTFSRSTIITDHSDPHALKAHYLDHFRRNRTAILEGADLGFDPPIKGCPGWDVAGLTAHMGRVYTFWIKWVSERPRESSRVAYAELVAEREARMPGYNSWEKAGFPRDSRPDGIIDFARETGDELARMLAGLQPEERVWTFVPTHQNGAFVFRRLAMETAIHRWDAKDAHRIARPFEPELARDGIDEMLTMFVEDPAYHEGANQRRGQTILLREHPGPGRWLVSFDAGAISTSHDAGPADVTVSGTASDLWLYIMGRRMAEELHVEGDTGLAMEWGNLAGRF